jgi:hypothetical protein
MHFEFWTSRHEERAAEVGDPPVKKAGNPRYFARGGGFD